MLRIHEIVEKINSEESFQQEIYIVEGIIRNQQGDDSKKSETRSLLRILSDINNDKNTPPNSKYYSIRFVKYFANKGYRTFIKDLAHSALYEDMVRLAKTVDPQKQPQDKGKHHFPDNQKLGNECIVEWSTVFYMIQQGQVSKFRKAYQQLKKLHVILPQGQLYQTQQQKYTQNQFPSSYHPEQQQSNTQSNYNALGTGHFQRQSGNDINTFFDKIQKPSPFNVIKNELNQFPQRVSKKTSSLTKYHKQNKSISRFNVMNNSGKSHDINFGQNIKLDNNDYDGTIISNTLTYWQQTSQLDKDQTKRFKTANFKDKSILHQDRNIMIGFKSKLIYQNVDAFKMFLKISLYFENKSNWDITNLSNQFDGDKTNVLYSASRKIESKIISQDQITQELLVIPTNIAMNLIKMRVNYSCNGQDKKINIILPNTVLQFSQFKDITVSDFKKKLQQRKSSIFRSDLFKLSRQVPPKFIRKHLQGILELVPYSQFQSQINYVQYQLGGHIQIAKVYDYLVKIIIRIDMKAVVQILPIENNEPIQDSVFYGKFLLQTFQFLLQEDSL